MPEFPIRLQLEVMGVVWLIAFLLSAIGLIMITSTNISVHWSIIWTLRIIAPITLFISFVYIKNSIKKTMEDIHDEQQSDSGPEDRKR